MGCVNLRKGLYSYILICPSIVNTYTYSLGDGGKMVVVVGAVVVLVVVMVVVLVEVVVVMVEVEMVGVEMVVIVMVVGWWR